MNFFRLKFLFLLMSVSFFVQAQESPTLQLSIPYQNSVLYNRYLVNPTFSFVGETTRNISMYSRNQWIAFNDSPKVYQLNYSGQFSDRTGYGIGLYSQNLGVITSFGGIGNAAYYVPFEEDMGLTLGANLVYYTSGVDMSRVDVENPDPYLASLDKRSLFSFHPGFNFNYKKWDAGMYAENLINFDFKTSAFVKQYSETTFSGHLMFTHFLTKDGVTLRALARVRHNQTFGFKPGISVMTNFPKWGWVQSGYDDYYGLAFGFGIHLSNKLSVGYVYEKTTNFGMQNLGGTHEFNLVFTLPNELMQGSTTEMKKASEYKKQPKKVKASTNEFSDTDGTFMEENLKLVPGDIDEEEPNANSKKIKASPELFSDFDGSFMEKKLNLVPKDMDYESEKALDKPKKKNVEQPPVSIIVPSVDMMAEKDIQKVFSKNTAYKRDIPEEIGQITVPTVNPGYYIIAGVFSKSQNVYRLIANLHKEGIEAMSFVNPENNYKYVYLRYYNTRKEALAAYYSNVDDTYFDTIWILKVDKK